MVGEIASPTPIDALLRVHQNISFKQAEKSARKRGDLQMRCRLLLMMAHCSLAIRDPAAKESDTSPALHHAANFMDVVNKTKDDALQYVQTARELHEHIKHLDGGAHTQDKQVTMVEIQLCSLEALLSWRTGQVEAAYQLALHGAKMVRVR